MTNRISDKNLKRPLLYLLIGSVVAGGLLGIVLVVRGEWGDFEFRVILTTVILAVASVSGLACDLARTPRGANVLPKVGMLLTFAVASASLVGIWFEINNETFWKTVISATILAVATVHICLLSIARLARRFQWVYLLACQIIFGLAIVLVAMIVGEINNDKMFRVIAVLSILDGALTLVIPLLHRLSKADVDRETIATPLEARNLAAIDHEIAQLKHKIVTLEKLRAEMTGGSAHKEG